MTLYRIVTRHVRYWRGQVHRWSNVYPFIGTIAQGDYAGALGAMYAMEQAIGYPGSTGQLVGGCYELSLYNKSSGGVPIANDVLFDWTTPASWKPYLGTGWLNTTSPALSGAETAWMAEWPAGLSKSGKPVTFRKWYHSVPETPAGATADMRAGDLTGLRTALESGIGSVGTLGIQLGNASRLASSTPTILPYFGNHQMPRGRRRKRVSINGKLYVEVPVGDDSGGGDEAGDGE